jgi:hypothetical protein
LKPRETATETLPEKNKVPNEKKLTLLNVDKKTLTLISDSINDVADENGWAFLGDVGSMIIKKKPDFDARNFGFSKLTPMLKSLKKYYDIDERETDKSKSKLVYIRNKSIAKDKKKPEETPSDELPF